MPVRAITARSVAHPPPQLFWNGVEGAKGFAKRSTWWDMLFIAAEFLLYLHNQFFFNTRCRWDMLFMGIRGIGLMTTIY